MIGGTAFVWEVFLQGLPSPVRWLCFHFRIGESSLRANGQKKVAHRFEFGRQL